MRTLPLSLLKCGSSDFFVLSVKVKFNRIKSATKFLCVKTSSGKVVVRPFPYLTIHRYWRENLKFSLRSDPPHLKNADFDRSASTVTDSDKKFNYDEWEIDHGLSNEL